MTLSAQLPFSCSLKSETILSSSHHPVAVEWPSESNLCHVSLRTHPWQLCDALLLAPGFVVPHAAMPPPTLTCAGPWGTPSTLPTSPPRRSYPPPPSHALTWSQFSLLGCFFFWLMKRCDGFNVMFNGGPGRCNGINVRMGLGAIGMQTFLNKKPPFSKQFAANTVAFACNSSQIYSSKNNQISLWPATFWEEKPIGIYIFNYEFIFKFIFIFF